MHKTVSVLAALALSTTAAAAAAAQPAVPAAMAIAAAASAQHHDGWRPGPGWDRDIDVRCASQDYRYRMCQVDTGQGGRVHLVRQISKTRCFEGRTWGWNRAGVWVDGGCEGVFRVQRRWAGGPVAGPGGQWRPGPGWDKTINVHCASGGYSYKMCLVDTGRGSRVRVSRQISKTRCVEGQTWGWNRAGVWVDRGCEAIFTVERRWR